MNETQRVLSDALELLRTKGWTKGLLARNEHFDEVMPDSPNAVCFCAIGACIAVSQAALDPDTASIEAETALDLAAQEITGDAHAETALFNDAAEDFAEVESWFTRAIELAGKDGE